MRGKMGLYSFSACRIVLLVLGVISLVGGEGAATAEQAGPRKQAPASSMPNDLFVSSPPGNAVGVRAARLSAQAGRPITLYGRIGGSAVPLAVNRAIFLLSDTQVPPCKPGCGCPTPWDYCCEPRDLVVANLATIQVADHEGRPLQVNLKGVHGLNPMSEVVVQGTVARQDRNMLLVNARHIYVKPAAR